jgi:hypothetical protein
MDILKLGTNVLFVSKQKHFIDTIKMIAYRAESSLAVLPREYIASSDDARALLRQIVATEPISSSTWPPTR